MSGVDNRIVTMKFDNKEFERNAQTSLTTIQKIKESMSFGSIANGTIRALGQIEGAALTALMIGLGRSLAVYFAPEFEVVVPYFIMVSVLLVRPQGLFAVPETRRI